MSDPTCECGQPRSRHSERQGKLLCAYDWTAYACWDERQMFGWNDPPPQQREFRERTP